MPTDSQHVTSNARPISQEQQVLSLIKVYTVYRILLCIALLATFALAGNEPYIGQLRPENFVYGTGVYLLFNLIVLLLVLPQKPELNSQQLFANFLIDMTAISIIIDASFGVNSGLGILLIIIVAASSMMLSIRLSLLIAALATISILANTTQLVSGGYLNSDSFVPSGLLGTLLFFTALLIQNLAGRIRDAQQLAEQRRLDVKKLQLLNQSIVQRMRTGILVVTQYGEIKLANNAASELLADPSLLNMDKSPLQHSLQPSLMNSYKRWQHSPQFRSPDFKVNNSGPELHANFSPLHVDTHSLIDQTQDTDTLIFIENNQRLAQQAQQMKLASLGRLTASIAHEIRNPLGAISHAAQLLNESEQLPDTDQRLCDIIQKQANRMNNVIENVLQLSRRSAPNPEKIILKQWLQQFINDYSTDNEADIKLSTTASNDAVTIDCSQLNQVLTNLAQNGLRYSKQHTGHASLELYVHTHATNHLPVLDIIDDGLGISETSREKLFEPFYTTEVKGSGLGLYISRELCEANEARLDYLKTTEGKSCFRISFPHPDRRLLSE